MNNVITRTLKLVAVVAVSVSVGLYGALEETRKVASNEQARVSVLCAVNPLHSDCEVREKRVAQIEWTWNGEAMPVVAR